MARIAGLDVPGIVKAAIAIADRDGLDKLTMRRLSAELGVTPMATYNHVSGKEELLDLVLDESIGQLGVGDPGDDPEAVILDWFLRLHDLLIEHPSLAQATAGRRIVGPQAGRAALALSEIAEGICHDLDRAAEMVVAAFWLTLGSGLHRASRHPGGYAADEHPEDEPTGTASEAERALRARVLATAGRDDQFRRSLAVLIKGHLSG
jgi:AcrR family transcriptional regulator